MEANTAQNDLQGVHQLALPEAGQVWPALGAILEHGSPILKALSSLSLGWAVLASKVVQKVIETEPNSLDIQQ